MLGDGDPTRAALADRLHISERTLARRLSARGVSFRELLDSVRKDLGSVTWTRRGSPSPTLRICLGFSDQSNFARSFRRWTGQTPSMYRARANVEAGARPRRGCCMSVAANAHRDRSEDGEHRPLFANRAEYHATAQSLGFRFEITG